MDVQVIKASSELSDIRKRKISRLRVAAYCRVSTDDEDQIKSYDSMVRHYTELIRSSPEWIFAGVYADRAITGTKVDKREEFKRLINDCLNGKIDLVIAKSIPRFARNTLDTLQYVRMLKERDIAVYFEVEKINTLKDGEFLMTILSSVAQQEVENTSAYVKKGLKMKMQRGELVGYQGCLGYDYDVKTKEISINEKGAEVVRYIFSRYVSGAGGRMIARELNEQKITTLKGNCWCGASVMRIIANEKYKGDLLQGKTFTVDPITKRRLHNLGEEDRFYVRDHHEAIIAEEIFDRAQEIRKKRIEGRKKGEKNGKREKYSRQFAFSCLIRCGYCGCFFHRRRWHSGEVHEKIMWQCSKSVQDGIDNCPDSKGIQEDVIETAFIESYRMLCRNNKDILAEFLKRVEKGLRENTLDDKIKKTNQGLLELKRKRKKLLDNYLEDAISQDMYEETDNDLKAKVLQKQEKIQMLEAQRIDRDNLKDRIADFEKALSQNEVLEEFDRGIFESIVEQVIIGGIDDAGNKDPYKITFIYKTGFRDSIWKAKEKFAKPRKSRGRKGEPLKAEPCFNADDTVKKTYLSDSVATCGDGLPTFP